MAAALQAGRVVELIVESGRAGHADVARLVEEARSRGLRVDVVADVRPLSATSAPQGVVARAHPLPSVALEDLTEPAPAALVVLDHLVDPHNVGAVARSAAAAGGTGLVVSERRSAPLGATAFKAAAGSLERLRVCIESSTADVIRRLQKLGIWTVGLSADGDHSLFGLSLLSEPVAVVVGGEGRGLGRLVSDRADLLARIPMAPETESLNASVAAALAMFEIARVRGRW